MKIIQWISASTDISTSSWWGDGGYGNPAAARCKFKQKRGESEPGRGKKQ
jgi:hypothetical protein